MWLQVRLSRKKNMKKTFFGILYAFLLGASPVFAGPVNVNTADATTLAQELNGVGEKTAQAIVEYREANGPFKSLDDLKNVKGVGDKVIENNQGNILF